MNRASSTTTCMAALLAMTAGCQPTGYKITPIPTDRTLKERRLFTDGGFVPPKIALIDVDGVLTNAPAWSLLGEGEHPVSLLLEKLEKAASDKQVLGVVLRINSPGGTVTASDLMRDELLRFKEKTGKPVVAVLMDVAASGGYYVASAADTILANRTSITGSIGVIMQTVNVAGTMAKIGVETDAIKSGPNKDAGSPFRQMTAEERALFQQIVDELHERFITVVDAGRPNLTDDRVRALADGRVFTAGQALDAGLIDSIGTLRDAIDMVKDRVGAQRVQVVTYHRPLGWEPNVYSQQPNRPVNVSLMNLSLPPWWTRPGPTFLYLWQPGM